MIGTRPCPTSRLSRRVVRWNERARLTISSGSATTDIHHGAIPRVRRNRDGMLAFMAPIDAKTVIG